MSSIILKPYRISEIDLDKIVYTNIKDGKNKKVIYLKYDNDSNNILSFQTTSLISLEDVKEKNGFYEIDIPLYGTNKGKVNQLVEFLKNLDKKIIEDAKKNSKKWFSGMKNITYKSVIRSSSIKTAEYNNGVLRIKITENSINSPILIDGTGKNINVKDIKKNSDLKMILECYAIWITNNGFGLYLKPVLMSFKEKKQEIKYQYQLLDESDDEIEQIEDVIDTEVNPTSHSAFIQEVLDNCSEDETSQIELPENLKILKNTPEKNEVVETASPTSYDDSEDNIQTYKNYTSEVKKLIDHKLDGINEEESINESKYTLSKTSSEEEADSLSVLKIINKNNDISKNMASQIIEDPKNSLLEAPKNSLSETPKISLIDSDLSDISASDEEIRKLKNIINTNI